MISNRESARRSRMRKQKHLDELWSQVVWLRNENHQLMDKLNHVSESHDQVMQENAQLKEQALELRQMIRDMQIHSPCPSSFITPLEDHHHDVDHVIPSAYLRSDSSNQLSNRCVTSTFILHRALLQHSTNIQFSFLEEKIVKRLGEWLQNHPLT